MLCLPMSAEASDVYYAYHTSFELCSQQGYSIADLVRRSGAPSVKPSLPAADESEAHQLMFAPTTASNHEAAQAIVGFNVEPVMFIEPGSKRFHKRYEAAEEGLTPDELSVEVPVLSVTKEPDEDMPLLGAYLPPDILAYVPPDITRGRVDRKDVAITFDGGSEDNDAVVILKALRERGIKTTIFLTGSFIAKYPELVRRMVADGHEIGNHTMSHPHLTEYERTYRQSTLKNVNRAMLGRELREAASLFKSVAGVEMAPLWRAPYGEVNPEIRRWAFEEGYVHVGWTYDSKRRESLDTLDWVNDATSKLYRTSNEIKDKILNFNKGRVGGGIVLMHLGSSRTTDKASGILGEMLDDLHKRGYRLVKLSTLLDGEVVMRYVQAIRQERIMKGMVRLSR